MRQYHPSIKQRRKALRLLYEQRVDVHICTPQGATATVVGDTGTYKVSIDAWGLTCKCKHGSIYRSRACAHGFALAMVWRAMYPREREDQDERSASPGSPEDALAEAARSAEGG